jgi:hypothetical protein
MLGTKHRRTIFHAWIAPIRILQNARQDMIQ